MTDQVRLREDSLEWRELDGQVVALEADRSLYLTANAAGSLLWHRLADGATRAELAAALCARYGIEAELAERDVDAFLASARDVGVLE